MSRVEKARLIPSCPLQVLMTLSSERAEMGMSGGIARDQNWDSREGRRKKKEGGLFPRLCWSFRESLLNSKEEKLVQGSSREVRSLN